jgi:hypothetical protein
VFEALARVAHRVGELIGLLARALEDVERETLRALRADAREPLQLVDQANEGFWERQRRGFWLIAEG